MLFALCCCAEGDVTLAHELALDLATQGVLVAFDRQEYDGRLGEATAKNACVVCRASAWIKVPCDVTPFAALVPMRARG